jgi:hypothetical protein
VAGYSLWPFADGAPPRGISPDPIAAQAATWTRLEALSNAGIAKIQQSGGSLQTLWRSSLLDWPLRYGQYLRRAEKKLLPRIGTFGHTDTLGYPIDRACFMASSAASLAWVLMFGERAGPA